MLGSQVFKQKHDAKSTDSGFGLKGSRFRQPILASGEESWQDGPSPGHAKNAQGLGFRV